MASSAWQRYWEHLITQAQARARKFREAGYPELAAQYEEEAEEIQRTFLADAVVAVPEDPGIDWGSLSELEKRYLDGDR